MRALLGAAHTSLAVEARKQVFFRGDALPHGQPLCPDFPAVEAAVGAHLGHRLVV